MRIGGKIGFLLNIASIFAMSSVVSPRAWASNSGVTYQGRILKPNGSPLLGQYTQFKMQIRTPDASNCLMYEEIQSLDMRNSNGSFSLTINDGSGVRTDSSGFGLDRIFANRGTFTFNPATCASGSAYAPNGNDGRDFVVEFKDETMASWEPIPAQKINFVPFAFESKQVQGFTADSLLRVVGAGGDPLTGVSPLSNAQYTELLALANGTSTQFTKSGELGGVSLPMMSTGEVLGWNGSAWVSTTTAGGANSVTTAMIQANAVDSSKIATGAIGSTQIANGAVGSTQIATGAVGSTQIANGAVGTSQIAGNVSINTTGTLGAAITTTRDFKIYAASPSMFYVGMLADPTLAASYTLTWPLDAGSANQVLTTDGLGGLSWADPATSSQWTPHGTNISYDGGGNVGIGTTSPTNHLDVVSSSGAGIRSMTTSDTNRAVVKAEAPNGTTSLQFNIAVTGENDNTFGVGAGGNAMLYTSGVTSGFTPGKGNLLLHSRNESGYIGFYTGSTSLIGSERLRIAPSGNIGIGATAPSALLHLKAGTSTAGTAPLKLTSSGSGVLLTTPEDGAMEYDGTGLWFTIGSTRYLISINTAAGNYSNVTNISNAGGSITMTPAAGNSVIVNQSTVSTSSSTGALVVNGGVGVAGAVNAAGNVTSGGTVSATNSMITPQIYGSTAASGNIKIDGTSDATKGFVLLNSAGGNVGIGTTSPSVKLMVSNGNFTNIRDDWYTGTSAITNSDVYFPSLLLQRGRTNSATPSYPATDDILGNLGFRNSIDSSYDSAGIRASASETHSATARGSHLQFLTTTTGGTTYSEKMRISPSGNVGIGTTAPSTKLHINGYSTASGYEGTSFAIQDTVSTDVGFARGFGIGVNDKNWVRMGILGVRTGGVDALNRFYLSIDPMTATPWTTAVFNILASGNVGIGTTAPDSTLDVSGDIVGSSIRARDSSDGNKNRIAMKAEDGNGVISGQNSISVILDSDNNNASRFFQVSKDSYSAATAIPLFTVMESGNVGIGTTSPSKRLHLQASDANAGVLVDRTSADNASPVFVFRKSRSGGAYTSGDGLGAIFVSPVIDGTTINDAAMISFSSTETPSASAAGNKIGFATVPNGSLAATTRMTIDSSGYVGIGTTAPVASLDINGNMNFSGTGRVITSNMSGTPISARMKFMTSTVNGNSYLHLSPNGTGTQASFMSYSSSDVDNSPYISIGATANNSYINSSKTGTGAAKPLLIEIAATPAVAIDTAGNVGIGTTSPTSLLTVNGSVTTGSLISTASITAVRYDLYSNGSSPANGFYRPTANTVGFSTNSTERMRIDATGKVGIGTTSPAADLQVIGLVQATNFRASANDASAPSYNFASSQDTGLFTPSNQVLGFSTSGTERMRIAASGNVGIGTSSPNQKLTVAGNIGPSVTNSYDLGSSSVLFKNAYVVNGVTTTSDARKKKGVRDSDLGLEFVNNLRPVSYYWKEGDQNLHYGVIAQETERALRQAKARSGRTGEVDNVIVSHDEKTDAYGVRYTELIAPIIKAIQELYGETSGVRSEVDALKARNVSLERAIASTDAKTAKLEAENQKLKRESAAIKAYLCAKEPEAAICR